MKKLLLIFILGIFLISMVSANILGRGLTNYYKFDETTGTNASDSIGGLHGTLNNMENGDWISAVINNGLIFGGTNENISTTLNMSSLGIESFSFWVNTSSVVGQLAILGNNKVGTNIVDTYLCVNDCGGISWGDNKLNLVVSDNVSRSLTSASTINDNYWHHVVINLNETRAEMWIDGVLENSSTHNSVGNPMPEINQIIAGVRYNDNFIGSLDEFGFWNRTLTSTDVSDLYGSGSGLSFDSFASEKITIETLSPAEGLSTFLTDLDFICNVSSIAEGGGITNVSFYLDGILNETNTSTVFGTYTFEKTGLSMSSHNWSCDVFDNETTPNQITTDTRNFTISSFTTNSETWTAFTTEGNVETFFINVSVPIQVQSAYLIWNGTSYAGTIDNSGFPYITATRSLTIPDIGVTGNVSFYWNITTASGTSSSTTHQQQITALTIDDCSVQTNVLLNYSLKDEEAQTLINGTVELDVGIRPFGSSTEILSYNKSYSISTVTDDYATVCINSNLSDLNYLLDVKAKYYSPNYSIEYNNIQAYALNETTLTQNINLLDLLNASSTIFTITYKDSSFLAVEGAIIDITREYVSEGTFKTVEKPITDTNGRTVAALSKDDTVYTIYVYKNGELLSTFNNVIAICQNELTKECAISLNALSSITQIEDYATALNLRYTLTYDSSTRTISTSFSTVDGSVSTINLSATVFTSYLNDTACSDSLTTSSGSIACVIPASYVNSTVLYELYKDGYLIESGIISLVPNPKDFVGTTGTIIALVLVLVIPFMFIASLTGMVIGAVIGVLLAGLLIWQGGGSSTTIVLSFSWLVIAAALLLWKLNSGPKGGT